MRSSFLPTRNLVSFGALSSTSKPYYLLQFSNFCRMNRGKNVGSGASNPRSFPPTSNRESSHHSKQENSSISANAKGGTSCTGTPQPRNSQHTPFVDFTDPQDWPDLTTAANKSRTKRAPPTTTSSNSAIGPLKNGSDRVKEHNIPERSKNVIPQARSTLPTIEYAYSCDIQVEPAKIEEVGVTEQGNPGGSENITSQPRKTSTKWIPFHPFATQAVTTSDLSKTGWSGVTQHESQPGKTSQKRDRDDYKPIDICFRPKSPLIKRSFYERNREKRKDLDRSLNDTQSPLLRPGMVLLKNFIRHADQLEIIKKCRDFGLGDGGFYQPGYNDGAKLRLHMMCLGKDWDPQTRSYGEIRSIDGAKPPIIPPEFKKLVTDALEAAYATMRENNVKNPEKAIPRMEPDICIVNFYTQSGKLGLHQDRDESRESIKKGLPVVSFSIGDSAEFLYGDDRDVDNAAKVELKSGDVVIFGGKSRDVFHGVPSIIPDSAPKFLADEVKLRPGRLNLTFRQY